MWRRLCICTLLLLSCLPLLAAHIAGGELFYQYLGLAGNGNHRYQVTLRLFRECTSNGPRLEGETVTIGIYHAHSLALASTLNLPKQGELQTIRLKASAIPCISGDTNVCYQVQYFSAEAQIPPSANGYILAWNRCCRANGILNIVSSNDASATYTAYLPWNHPTNNSPVFNVKDTALVCAGKPFVLDFGATDADGDSLTYSFTPAHGGPSSQGTTPSSVLNMPSLTYTNIYTGTEPMGNQVKINAATGVISGNAPPTAGRLVVNVTITEWRNGLAFSTHRKDFMIKVGDCDFVEAKLKPAVNCKSFTQTFENQSRSGSVLRYEWDFGDPNSTTDTSQLTRPSYQYPDTGLYIVRLTAYGSQGCKASDSTQVRLYPGFQPRFKAASVCFKAPIQFHDSTKASYGVVNEWHWNFGDLATLADTSMLQHPLYKYNQPTAAQVRLIVGSTKGCRDTVEQMVNISAEPGIVLPPEQPLCKGDSMAIALEVQGSGATFQWSPPLQISSTTAAQPRVWPPQSRTYQVRVDQDGCEGVRSVFIRVVNNISITLNEVPDLCQGDSVFLQARSDANLYRWEPPTYLQYADSATTFCRPDSIITYTLHGSLGSCSTSISKTVKAYPLPQVNAGTDTVLCAGSSLRLQGQAVGNSFAWMPNDGSLNSTSLLSPTARPLRHTVYALVVFGNQGCKRTLMDSVVVRVNPLPKVFAGNDTNVVMGRPLQLKATGASQYQWLPATYFADAGQPNPRIQLPVGITPVMLVVKGTNADGCFGYDTLWVKQFDGLPEIYVPTAFTPNADGRNDVLRAIPAGVQFRSFRVFDRLGVMVFATANASQGWDGVFRGVAQPGGTYVFVAEGVDGEGQTLVRRGTSVLIR